MQRHQCCTDWKSLSNLLLHLLSSKQYLWRKLCLLCFHLYFPNPDRIVYSGHCLPMPNSVYFHCFHYSEHCLLYFSVTYLHLLQSNLNPVRSFRFLRSDHPNDYCCHLIYYCLLRLPGIRSEIPGFFRPLTHEHQTQFLSQSPGYLLR